MNSKTELLFTKAKPQTTLGKIVQFPLTRIIIAILFLAPVSGINNVLAIYVTEPLQEPFYTITNTILAVICFFLFLMAYRLFTKHIEKREAYEISRKSSMKELGLGFLIGLVLVLLIVTVIALSGFYQIENLNTWTYFVNAIVIFGIGAFIQELFIRGILFRILEEKLGTWITIAIVTIIFGVIHIGNENAGLFSTISLILSDVLLCAAFIYTRRIWLVWGIHFGWNFFQDGIFGMPNSGISKLPSLINSTVNGPEWLTGGSFGIENSLLAIVLNLVIGIVILKKAWDKDLFVKAVWKRSGLMTPSDD